MRAELTMPAVAPELLARTTSLPEWRKRQGRLDSVWARVERGRAALRVFAGKAVDHSRSTDLFGSLEYVSHYIGSDRDEEVYVVIYSDLEHDYGNVVTRLPPVGRRLDLAGVHVEALFTPWRRTNSWSDQESEWRKWLIRQCGTASFAMWDPAQSKLRKPVPASPIPLRLHSPVE